MCSTFLFSPSSFSLVFHDIILLYLVNVVKRFKLSCLGKTFIRCIRAFAVFGSSNLIIVFVIKTLVRMVWFIPPGRIVIWKSRTKVRDLCFDYALLNFNKKINSTRMSCWSFSGKNFQNSKNGEMLLIGCNGFFVLRLVIITEILTCEAAELQPSQIRPMKNFYLADKFLKQNKLLKISPLEESNHLSTLFHYRKESNYFFQI